MAQPSIFQFAGGGPAFLALAAAHHQRRLGDPVLNHPFSHPGNPGHIERPFDCWAEAFGGPKRSSESFGGPSAMLGIHAGQGADEDLGRASLPAFVQAADDDAGLSDDPDLRNASLAYMEWAVGEVPLISSPGEQAPADLPVTRWGWNGLE